RCTHRAARELPYQSAETEAHRRMFWLAEDHRAAAQGAASWSGEGRLGVCLRLRRLQPGPAAKPVGAAGVGQARSVSAGPGEPIQPAEQKQAELSSSPLSHSVGTEFG